MSKAEVVAAILTLGVTMYAVFAGADFGGGMWDLLSGQSGEGDRAQAQIDSSIAPVWEANHVWLIFVLVVAWTAFPPAFSAVMSTLYIPLALAALGIVLRGSGFAFRHALPGPLHDPATRVFGVSSVLTPFFLGTVVGAIASGEVPADGNGDPTASWTGVLPLLTGAMFVAAAAYLAAVFLVRDAGASGDEGLQRYFARRALVAAVVAGAAALAGIFALKADAEFWKMFLPAEVQSLALPLVTGKYVKVPSNQSPIPTVDMMLKPLGDVTKGEQTTVAGKKVITVETADGKLHVSLEGKPYPVDLVSDDGTIEFTDIDADATVSAPAASEVFDLSAFGG